MLLTIPTELQAYVCSFLQRSDLASVVRACSDLYAVAVRLLYQHVELHSFDQVEAFFHIGANPIAVKGSDIKGSQWERIKTLAITIAPADDRRTLRTLPQSLAGPGVGPLQLDCLRITYDDDAACLLPLLNCLSSTELGLYRTSKYLKMRPDRWMTSIPSWSNVARVTLTCQPTMMLTVSQPPAAGVGPACPRATSAKLMLPSDVQGPSFALWALSKVIVQLCPNLEGAEISLYDERPSAQVRFLRTMGTGPRELGGKPASFWSIVAKPDGTNIWGDVEDMDA